jgi:hypothetical protein
VGRFRDPSTLVREQLAPTRSDPNVSRRPARLVVAAIVAIVMVAGCRELPKIQPPSLGLSSGAPLGIDPFVNGRQ